MEISLLADYKNEAPKIAKWYYDEWSGNDTGVTVESITDKILLGANRTRVPILYLGHVNGNVIGAGEIKYRQLDEYPDYKYWLDGVFVISTHRGRGFSTKLIEFAKEKAIELGILALYLRCTLENVKLYEARGYKVLTTEGSKYIMGLQLST